MDGNGRVKDTIPTTLRLLHVIEALSEAGDPVTPTEINQRLGLPKPTIHRLFATLEAEGFIQRDIDGRRFSPGLRARTMSAGILSSLRIRTARTAILGRLAEDIGETCNIALADRDAMIYLDRVETKWPLRIQLPIGTRVPFFCTASGKLYLSSLTNKHLQSYLNSVTLEPQTPKTLNSAKALMDEIKVIRATGVATDNEEFMVGMIAVAVPILDANKRLVSTLSFHAPSLRLSLSSAEQHLARLHQAAKNLSSLISE